MKYNKLRSHETWTKYIKHRKSKVMIYGTLVKSYWFGDLFVNPFPYDNVADTHHILWLSRPYWLTKLLLPYIIKKFKYDCVIINILNQSIPDMPHIHFVNWNKISL